MPELVVSTAQMTCTFGAAPAALTVAPAGAPTKAGGQLVARITDITPMSTIAAFGMCSSLSNPQVASATSAASGVLTPQPCIPVIAAPWTPGSAKVTVGGTPALTSDSRCTCSWGGSISVTSAGQTTVTG